MLNGIPQPIRGDGFPPTGREILAFGTAWPKFVRPMKRWAFMLTNDADHQEDLMQEVMVTLWNADPTRWDFRNEDHVKYMTRMLINRMYDVWGEHERLREKAEAIPGEVHTDAMIFHARAAAALRRTLAPPPLPS